MSWLDGIARRLPTRVRSADGDRAAIEAELADARATAERAESTVRDAVDDLTDRLAALEQRLRAVERARDEG